MMRPNISLRPVARRRACTFLKYWNSWTTSKTLRRVFSEMYSVSLSTRETVASDTPARLATSRIVWAIIELGYLIRGTPDLTDFCVSSVLAERKAIMTLPAKAIHLDKAHQFR